MRLDFTTAVFIAVSGNLGAALIANTSGWYTFLSIVAWLAALVMVAAYPDRRG